MRILFGVESNKKNLKKYINEKKFINSLYNDDNKENSLEINKDAFELKAFIKEFDKIEENIILSNKKNENKIEYNINNKNGKIKSKLKLDANEIKNNQKNKMMAKNYDLFNSNTNNSTNLTNSSNIKANINIKNKSNNNLNINNSNYFFTINNKSKINKNIKNSIIKSKDKTNNIYTNKTKTTDDIKTTPKPYLSLQGLNFILKNPIINNLISQDLNIKNKEIININQNKNPYYNNFYCNSFKNKALLLNNITKFNSLIKQNKIPKIDVSKLDIINNNILTIMNRNKSRNNKEMLKRVSQTVSKSYKKKKKNLFRNFEPTLTLSPLNGKIKNIFGQNNNTKFLHNKTNSHNIKSMNCKKSIKEYCANKNLKNLQNKKNINEYMFKKNYFLNINIKMNNKKKYINEIFEKSIYC